MVSVGYADASTLWYGKALGAADVDKWALYALGQYCDHRFRMALVVQNPV